MVGANFPSLTHDALNDFTNAIKERNIRLTKPLDKEKIVPQTARSAEDIEREERISRCLLYRSHTGITPNYKGHIPGIRTPSQNNWVKMHVVSPLGINVLCASLYVQARNINF